MSKIELKKRNNKSKNRVGRGISAGGGKTAGRGTKGQKSRSGFNIPRQFEGGQTPLSMRLPKLPGFKSHRGDTKVISLDDISNMFSDGEKVSQKSLREKGLIGKNTRYKILDNGELTVKVDLSEDVAISKSAAKKFAKEEENTSSKEAKDKKKSSKAAGK